MLTRLLRKCQQEVLQKAHEGTFKELAAFARMQHTSTAKRRASEASLGYQRLVPTAMAVAGGVNSTDHARTFPELVTLLRSQVWKLKQRSVQSLPCRTAVRTNPFCLQCYYCHFRSMKTTVRA